MTEIHPEESITITIQGCKLGSLKMDQVGSDERLELNVTESITEDIRLSDININKDKEGEESGKIDLSRTATSMDVSIEGIGKNMYLDISSLSSRNLKTDDALVAPIEKGKLPERLFTEEGGIDQKINTLRFLSEVYHSKGNTKKKDKVIFLLRDLEMEKRIGAANNRWSAMIEKGKLFIGKYIFGWGVNLSRLFVAFGVATFLFGVIHGICMYLNDGWLFRFKQEGYTEPFATVKLSLFYMLGFYSDIIEVQGINHIIGVVQHIVGLAYITLIMVVVIRRLID